MIEIIDFKDKYFDGMVDCYKVGFPKGYNRYALSRLVRHQKDTVFLAIKQELVVGVLIGIANYGGAWFSGLTVLPKQPMQKCALRLACAVANRFVDMGFAKAYFTTERRGVLELAKLVSAEKIVEKREIHNKELGGSLYFKKREVWWCSLGLNIGYEEDGKNNEFLRPVLILKVFSWDVLWVLPMTSKDKIGKYYYQLTYRGKKFSIILSQLRLISSKRLLRKIRTLPHKEFDEVRKCTRGLI